MHSGLGWSLCAFNISGHVSSFLGGFLLDTAGTGPTLAFSTVTGGTGMGILWIMLRQGQAKAAVQQG